MSMKLKLVTPPASEPITLTSVKDHLRLDLSYLNDDRVLSSLITAARAYVEEYLGRALVTQTWDLWLDGWPYDNRPAKSHIDIPLPPLQSVTSLTYWDVDSTEYTLTEGTEFTVDTESLIGRIVLDYDESWPTEQLHPNNPIKIRFVAGYLDTSSLPVSVDGVPAPIKHAMRLLIGHWHASRMAVGVDQMHDIPFGVKAILGPYRVQRWWI